VVVRSTFPPDATWLTDRELETVTAAEAIVGIETNNPETRAKMATEDMVEEGNILLIRMSKIISLGNLLKSETFFLCNAYSLLFVFTKHQGGLSGDG
jgi:hypothetical protein